MNFEQRCTVAVSRPELWDFLLDVPQMAACVPAARDVIADGDGSYTGVLRVKLGPIHLNLQGVMSIQERDQEHWRATARVEAKDRRIGGGANVSGKMTLVELAPDTTELLIQGQVRFLGKLGEFGEPIIRKQADATVTEFVRNVAAHFQKAASAPGREAEAGPIAQPPEPVQVPSPPAPSARIPWRGMLAGIIGASVILSLLPLPALAPLAWLVRTAVVIAMLLLAGNLEKNLRSRS